MHLYLVQHAEALTEEEDTSRSLSEKGIGNIKRVAAFVAGSNIRVEKICHSGKMRALQTAQVLAEHLKFGKNLTYTDGLSPLDDPRIWLDRLSRMNEDILLAGHLPHSGRLASLLLCGDGEKNIIDFKMGGVVCLKRSEDGKWAVDWMITPEMFK
ncbi:MAG: phosphohistidine phosphatase SixA [Nitrospiraceae bacterium]|nr:MAG: phosphohistidine phosphatase SixA [Nitrospiraceae bacterium]